MGDAATTTCAADGTTSVAATCNDGFYLDTTCKKCTDAAAPVANAMYTCASVAVPTAFTCNDGFFKNAAGDACTACTAITNAGPVVCTSATTSVGLCNTGFEMMSKTVAPLIVCTACDAISNAAVTCTYPGNSQIATCNANFELKSGACTAVATPADATAPAPAAALSAATSLVQSWSSIIV